MERIYKPSVQGEQTHISEAVVKKLVAASNCIGVVTRINFYQPKRFKGILGKDMVYDAKTAKNFCNVQR